MPPDSSSLWERIRATEAEHRSINETLRDGERLLWLGRPKPDLRPLAALLAVGVAVVWFWPNPLFVALLCIVLLSQTVRVLILRFRKVYAVTNRRSIVLTRGIFRFKVESWDVHDYLSIERKKNGRGSIIYADDGFSRGVVYLQYGQQGLDKADADRRGSLDLYTLDGGPICGLLDLRDVETVAALVKVPPSETSTAPVPEDFITEDYIPEREKPMSTMKTVLWICLFACVGAVGIWGSSHYLKTAIGMSFSYLPVTGTVTSVEVSSGRGTCYTPRYSYVVDGQRYETQSIGSSGYRHIKPGDSIDLRYPPGRPQDAKVDDPAVFWGVGIFLGVLAILFSGFAVGYGYDAFRRTSRKNEKNET